MISPMCVVSAEELPEEAIVLRAPTRNYSKNYSYNGTTARLDITYTIDQSTGNIKEIVDASVTRLSGGTVSLVYCNITGPNTVSVSVNLGEVCTVDSINLY